MNSTTKILKKLLFISVASTLSIQCANGGPSVLTGGLKELNTTGVRRGANTTKSRIAKQPIGIDDNTSSLTLMSFESPKAPEATEDTPQQAKPPTVSKISAPLTVSKMSTCRAAGAMKRIIDGQLTEDDKTIISRFFESGNFDTIEPTLKKLSAKHRLVATEAIAKELTNRLTFDLDRVRNSSDLSEPQFKAFLEPARFFISMMQSLESSPISELYPKFCAYMIHDGQNEGSITDQYKQAKENLNSCLEGITAYFMDNEKDLSRKNLKTIEQIFKLFHAPGEEYQSFFEVMEADKHKNQRENNVVVFQLGKALFAKLPKETHLTSATDKMLKKYNKQYNNILGSNESSKPLAKSINDYFQGRESAVIGYSPYINVRHILVTYLNTLMDDKALDDQKARATHRFLKMLVHPSNGYEHVISLPHETIVTLFNIVSPPTNGDHELTIGKRQFANELQEIFHKDKGSEKSDEEKAAFAVLVKLMETAARYTPVVDFEWKESFPKDESGKRIGYLKNIEASFAIALMQAGKNIPNADLLVLRKLFLKDDFDLEKKAQRDSVPRSKPSSTQKGSGCIVS